MKKVTTPKTCLVLGATGFIGGHIAMAAYKHGYITKGLRRTHGDTGHIGDTPIDWIEGDLENKESLLRAMKGVDIVFHAAGYYPSKGRPNQVKKQVEYGRLEIDRVLEAAYQAEVDMLVYTSSLTTIGNPTDSLNRLADESDLYIPGTVGKSGYYECKQVMEERVLHANGNTLRTIVLNPTAVFGPGDVHMTMGKILLAIQQGYVRIWIKATTNVVDVRDVAAGHIAAAEKGRAGERYILGGENVSLKEIITRVGNLFNISPPQFEIPVKAITLGVWLIDLIPFLSAGNHLRALPYWQGFNMEKAKKELGFTTRPFEETVMDAMDWFRENGFLE